MPFFTVVIPVYNKANFIGKTLQSVLDQGFKDFDVILVDDGSTDQSRKVIEQFVDPRFKIYYQNNKGASSARNFGIKQAKSTWIALLDADDIWYKNHLQELYKCILKFSNADVVSNAYEIELSDNFTKTPNYSKPIAETPFIIKDYFSYSLIDPLFWTSSLAFKKACFKEIGGFDISLKTGQDIDLFIRFALNFNLAYNPKVTMKYRRFTENNLSLNVQLAEKKKYIDKHKLHELENMYLKKYLDINRFSLLLQSKLQGDISLYKNTLKDINYNNLSIKQKILLKLSGNMLMTLKKIQFKMIKLGIYKSAF